MAKNSTIQPRQSKATSTRQSSEQKLAELRKRLSEIDDLAAAGATLGWDQLTYMPRGGGASRARQRATLSRLAHQQSVSPELGRLLDQLGNSEASRPYDSDEASLIRVARRDFERAIRIPPEFVARATEFSAQSYEAWKRARPADDFARMLPFLERAIDF